VPGGKLSCEWDYSALANVGVKEKADWFSHFGEELKFGCVAAMRGYTHADDPERDF
jgi:hypothetical protein